MLKKDFIMQLMEQLFQGLLPYILDLVKAGRYDEAHAVIDQAVRELVGIGTDGVVQMPDDVLMGALKADQAISWEAKALFLATVLVEDADILATQDEEDAAYGRTIKALNLCLILSLEGDEDIEENELTPEIDELLTALSEYHLPGQTSAYLIAFYEKEGDYARAEDVLFDWLENNPTLEPNPVEIGLAFFERLQTRTDEELRQGNLSRDEVASGLAELKAGG